VIHGHGTGALRKVVRETSPRHPTSSASALRCGRRRRWSERTSRSKASHVEMRKKNILLGIVVASVMVAALPALVQLGWHARLFAGRATFPLDLEWMEGGRTSARAADCAGKGIYVAPSLDFIPFLYTPLYPALIAALSFILRSVLAGRLVSILAFAVALALVVITSMGETQGRGRKVLAASSEFPAQANRRQFYLHWLLLRFGPRDSLLLALQACPLAGLARAGLEERCHRRPAYRARLLHETDGHYPGHWPRAGHAGGECSPRTRFMAWRRLQRLLRALACL